MKIFFIWLGIICCGAANGFAYANFYLPERFFVMAGVSMVALVILILHRSITFGWRPYPDMWTGFRLPIFRITLAMDIIVMLLALCVLEESLGTALSILITIAIASLIASIREAEYIDNII